MQIKAPSTLQDLLALGWERVSPRPSIMDRTYWIQVGQFLPGEKVILQQKVVRLYDGDERVSFVNVNRFRLVSASLSHRHRSIVELYNWRHSVLSGMTKSRRLVCVLCKWHIQLDTNILWRARQHMHTNRGVCLTYMLWCGPETIVGFQNCALVPGLLILVVFVILHRDVQLQ